MKSYLGNTKLKTQFVKEIKKHQEADQLAQGTYGRENGNWKGCAVACSLRSLDIMKGDKLEVIYDQHERYESELGIPEWLARLEDTIFEGLPKKEAMEWPLRFSKAIPVGADLNSVKWQFCAFILGQNIERVLTLDIADDLKKQVVDSIRGVLSLHKTAIQTGKWDESAAWSAAESAESAARSARSARSAERSAWSAAWSAARSAAESAESAESERSARSAAWSARSAAWSAARSAAESAESAESERSARSAAWSARSAAWSAARSAAESAWSAEYIKYADKLIELLKASK